MKPHLCHLGNIVYDTEEALSDYFMINHHLPSNIKQNCANLQLTTRITEL